MDGLLEGFRFVEFVLGFLLFSAVIIANAFITKSVVVRPKNPKTARTLAIALYPVKFLIYLGVLIFIDRWIGLTSSFLLGVTGALAMFIIGIIITYTVGNKMKR